MRRLPIAISGIIILLAFLRAEAQQFTLRQYTAVDGLPQSQVNAIIEDKFGYLWIGTYGGGLARFDGREFKVYTTLDGLLSNIVTSLFIDSHQNIWIVHPRGLSRFDGVSFKKFQPAQQNESLKRIRRIAEFNDTIYIVSNPGMIGKIFQDSLYYWSRNILPNKTIFFTHLSPDKKVVYYLNDSSFIVPSLSGYKKIPHGKLFYKTYSMFNHKNEIWIDTDSGFFALDIEKGNFSKRSRVLDRYIICYDAVRDVYWTRDERTLFRESIRNGVVRTDTVLKNVPIMQVHLDAEGNTWLGSSGNGLYRYYPRDFDKISPGYVREVMAVEKDKDNTIWIGSSGLSRIVNGKIFSFPLPNGNDDGVLTIKTSNTGEVWLGSYSGLGRYSPSENKFSWFTRENGLSSAYVTQLDFDDKGGLWIGTTGGGINYYDGQRFSQPPNQQVLGTKNISALRFMKSTQSLFIGSDLGIHVLHGDSVTSIPLPEFENTNILSLAILRDTLVVAGSGGAGVMVIDPVHNIKKLIGPREGLPSGFVFFVATDDMDRIWVGTEKGITRMKIDKNLEILQTRDFGYDNGLLGIETNQNAYYFSKTEKYFGLIDGLYHFNEAEDELVKSYPVHLSDVEIQYGEISIREFGNSKTGFFKIPENAVLPSDKNHITFYFNRVDKRYPSSVRYKYFLRNFDKTWSHPTSMGNVTYSNLPPGSYEFEVLATDKLGSWDRHPMTYSFIIKAPFYQTITFYALSTAVLVSSFILFVLVRLRKNVSKAIEVERIRQQEQESLRKEIARDFHDEMGNQLTRIINYVSLMRLKGNGQSPELYHKVEESAKYLYNGTRDFIWAIDPVNDDLSKLFLHIRDFGEKLFEEKEINFRAYNEVKDKVRLPYGFSREANLIFKEAMTNVFKHSGAENVSFILKATNDVYEMTLEDDGKGFDPETIRSNGVKNIRSRAEKLRAELLIEKVSAAGGTRIQLRFSTLKLKSYDPGNKKTRINR